MLVEIWSDIVCPWCAIGKARFESALAQFDHAADVEVVWRSFELDPNAPRERDVDLVVGLARKYRTDVGRAQQMLDQMTENAAAEGLTFRFDIAQHGNTFDAHRVLHLAKERGLQHEVGEAFFSAYLTEGRHIADHAVLQEVAVAAGLDEVEVKDVLTTDRYADAVRADEAKAHEIGVRGVPFFVVDGTYGVSGAQTPDVLLNVLNTAWKERAPLQMVGGEAGHDAAVHEHGGEDACADGSCAI